jgi:RimJ/RimL family protein N-acetyltransferase
MEDTAERESWVGFRPLEIEADLPDLLRWLADPDVRPWYDEGELTEENIGTRFAPEPPMRKLIILIDGAPVGYIQVYRLADEEAYRTQVDVVPEAVAIDLLIGEPGYRNRGWGTSVLRACLRQVVFGEMDAPLAMIAPDPENARAVRSYAKAGFRPVKTVYVEDEDPGNTGWEQVMLLTREEFMANRPEGS